MQTEAIAEFAVKGELGLDVFRRIAEPAERRSRFECIATLRDDSDDAPVIAHTPYARRNPRAVRRAVAAFSAAPELHRPFALGDPAGYPAHPGSEGAPLTVFLYLDFLRSWQIADMAVRAVEAGLEAATPVPPADLAAALRLLLDFNRLQRGCTLSARVLPQLRRRTMLAAARRDDAAGNAGYALRLAGDLLLRAGRAEDALAAFETALRLGDNRFRRHRAIVAASQAGNAQALQRHRDAFARRWTLPEGLADPAAPASRPARGETP